MAVSISICLIYKWSIRQTKHTGVTKQESRRASGGLQKTNLPEQTRREEVWKSSSRVLDPQAQTHAEESASNFEEMHVKLPSVYKKSHCIQLQWEMSGDGEGEREGGCR